MNDLGETSSPRRHSRCGTRILMAVLLLAVTGCSAVGFDRGALRQRMAGEEREISDEEIARAYAVEPQLSFPMKLAVYADFRGASTSSRTNRRASVSLASAQWTVGDKETVLALADGLKQRDLVSDMFFMSEVTVEATDLKGLRLAAARHGADALLVISMAGEVDRYYRNALGLFDILLIPGFFVPASRREALVLTSGAMWDVGNGFLYASAESEGLVQRDGPTFLENETNETFREAKAQSLKNFCDEIAKRIRNLRGG